MKNTHGRTCKKTKVYIYLYISPYENVSENGCIYIYIIHKVKSLNSDDHKFNTNLFRRCYIYIYIHPFSETFSYGEIYIDRYILLFSCTCARVHFSLVIVQLVKKLGSTIIFFFVGFFVPI